MFIIYNWKTTHNGYHLNFQVMIPECNGICRRVSMQEVKKVKMTAAPAQLKPCPPLLCGYFNCVIMVTIFKKKKLFWTSPVYKKNIIFQRKEINQISNPNWDKIFELSTFTKLFLLFTRIKKCWRMYKKHRSILKVQRVPNFTDFGGGIPKLCTFKF